MTSSIEVEHRDQLGIGGACESELLTTGMRASNANSRSKPVDFVSAGGKESVSIQGDADSRLVETRC